MKFKEYLEEAFNIRKINFGNNLEMNNETFSHDSGVYYTFFKTDQYYYVIGYDNNSGEIGFGLSKELTLEYEEYKDLSELKNLNTTNTLRLYNYILYMYTIILDKFKPKMIIFSGAIPELEKLYDGFVKNKSFLKIIEEHNYKFVEKYIDDGVSYFKFERI